jgi:hypothetical protein
MGSNLENLSANQSKNEVLNEKKLRLRKNNNLKIEDFSPRVMTVEEIKKERIEKYQFVI